MGDRYWGLQTADWNGASGWFSDAGLTIPAADPTSSDDVKFVAGSFTGAGQILTVNSNVYCKDIDWTGALNTPTLTFTTGARLGIYGNCTLINAMVIPTSVNTFIVFHGDSNHSLTTNGVTINTQCVGSYSGTGTLTLLDDLNCRTLLLREGVLNTNGKTVTGSDFYSPYTYVRGLFLGGSTLNFTGYGWDCRVSTNLTLNAGTSTINLSSSGIFAGGGLTYNNVRVAGAGAYTLTVTGDNTFNSLSTGANQTLVLGSTTQTVNSWEMLGALAANTATINVDNTGTFAGGDITTYNNIAFIGTAHTITGAFTCASLDLGAETISCTDWLLTATSFTCGTSVINLTGTGAFAGNGKTYNTVNWNGTSHTISGSNTFAKLGLNPTGTQTITWTDRSNNKIGEMTRTGSEIITFQGSGAAGWALIAIGGIVCSLYNMSISRGTATARRFFAGTNSTNGGNNVGWLFHNKPNACFTALRTPATQLCVRR